MILLMQVGFAFLEAGAVRYKNTLSIIIKVFMSTCVAIIMWWLIGYGLAFGPTSRQILGTNFFAGNEIELNFNAVNFVFSASLACAANSIVSGGAAERMTFIAYFVISVFFSGIIFPITSHWAWGNGWL